jgi:ribosomal-protein-alanine acetyltransferase
MKPSTRAAQRDDLEAVLAIEKSWPTTAGWTRAQFESELENPRSRFVVAEEEGRLAGYAVFWSVPPEAQILDIAVAPDSARRGLGRFLLDVILAHARRLGLKKATLEVRAGNEAALALYRAAGFSVVGRRPRFYPDGEDAVLMDLGLS